MRRLLCLLTTLTLTAGLTTACSETRSASGSLFAQLLDRSSFLGPLDTHQRVDLVLWTGDGRRARESIVARTLAAHGISVDWHAPDPWLLAEGPAGNVASLFGTRIGRYRSSTGERFYAADPDPTVPPSLRAVVRRAGRISSYEPEGPMTIPAGGLSPVDTRRAYDIDPLLGPADDGSGTTVVFVETDGYSQSDLDAFAKKYGFPRFTPVDATGNGTTVKADGEATMDLEVVHAIAPSARLVVYTAGADAGWPHTALLRRALLENPGAIVSISLGVCEKFNASADLDAVNNLFSKASKAGTTVFVSAGDSGAYECLRADWSPTETPTDRYVAVPFYASSPWVTAVGGTRLSVRRDGTYYRETVWEEPAETAGTGGGQSCYFDRPKWQTVIIDSMCPGHRTIPDVAADADPLSGMGIIEGGKTELGGGTSQAAPIWAGITALIDTYLAREGRKPVGFFNPTLYRLGTTRQPLPPFHDVTVGGNLRDDARPGYDLATGFGTPDAWNLARDLAAVQPKVAP